MSEDKCKFCGSSDEVSGRTCDHCWYGMRINPEAWVDEMKRIGVEVKRGIGCSIIPGFGIACGAPYVVQGEAVAIPTKEDIRSLITNK